MLTLGQSRVFEFMVFMVIMGLAGFAGFRDFGVEQFGLAPAGHLRLEGNTSPTLYLFGVGLCCLRPGLLESECRVALGLNCWRIFHRKLKLTGLASCHPPSSRRRCRPA